MNQPNWRRWLPTLALSAALAACGGGDSRGGSCEKCRGEAPRCDTGLQCRDFIKQTGGTVELCADSGTTRCDLSPFSSASSSGGRLDLARLITGR